MKFLEAGESWENHGVRLLGVVETKGRIWEGTLEKDDAMEDWCSKVSDQTKTKWRYVRVNQIIFGDGKKFSNFQNLTDMIHGTAKSGLFV